MKDKKKIGLILMYLSFGIVMAGLGANDALRGVFSPIFKDHFTLSSVQISMIIVMSYAGNLIFLWAGTRLADRFEKKKVMMGILLIWMAALLVYVTTDNYYVLLITMLFTMGASTLMNTMINLFVPMYFAAPGLIVNTLFFVQGIGTTGSQMILGQVATGFPWWQKTNLLLFSLGLIGLILFLFAGKKAVVLKSETTDAKNNFDSASKAKVQMNSPILWLLVLVFGFYFIGEHGVLNWLLLYCKDQFGMDSNQASIYLSMFSGTMMMGTFTKHSDLWWNRYFFVCSWYFLRKAYTYVSWYFRPVCIYPLSNPSFVCTAVLSIFHCLYRNRNYYQYCNNI